MGFFRDLSLLVLMCFVCLKNKKIIDWVFKFLLFIRVVFFDILKFFKNGRKRPFKYFGVRVFCGRQGAGKTIGMVWYLERIRKQYPKCKIYTNFEYEHATGLLTGLNDLLEFRNGEDGVVFAIDEIQNEFSSTASKDFPESILSTITMQRKQKICILTTAQTFTRMAKPLREQTFQVVDCRTVLGRWTSLRAYHADDYNTFVDNPTPEKKFKCKKVWRDSFIQTDDLRSLYDTWQVVERLSRQGFKAKETKS